MPCALMSPIAARALVGETLPPHVVVVASIAMLLLMPCGVVVDALGVVVDAPLG